MKFLILKTSPLLLAIFILGITIVACNPTTLSPSPNTTPTLTLIKTAQLTIVSSVTPSSVRTNYRGDRFGITFDYPSGWHLTENPEEPVDVLLTSYDPAFPPHKLEWDDTTVRIAIRVISPEDASDSLEMWAEKIIQEAEEAHLSVFSDERLALQTGFPAAHITLVSGSGGILGYVLVDVEGRQYEIVVQGNFDLAKAVLDTLRSSK